MASVQGRLWWGDSDERVHPIKIIDLAKKSSNREIGSAPITCMAYSAVIKNEGGEREGYQRDGNGDIKVCLGFMDATVRIFSLESGALERCLVGHAEEITAIAWSAPLKRKRRRMIVSAARDHSIKIWDARTGLCLHDGTCSSFTVVDLNYFLCVLKCGVISLRSAVPSLLNHALSCILCFEVR